MSIIKIFDTTLRDGEQAPGCSMNLKEKLEVARCLERLRVDVIEAGFAISSPGDFESVSTIAREVKECTVASLARATEKDIDCAWEAVKHAADPRIHLFLATSPVHMQYKLRMSPQQVLEQVEYMTAYAKKYVSNVEFSAEDATRSDADFLCKVVERAIRAGATVINIPDTVGYTTPAEMQHLISMLIGCVPGADKVEFSVHCHNDLGMAVANSLGGVMGGARQIECTINGLGERAGNTSMEEVVMAMRTRPDLYAGIGTRIDTTQISRASKTVYNLIGQPVPLNKPIVGRNAFLHESGIHQHGVLANKKTYEILTPEAIGIATNNIVLGKHSGKHAFEERLQDLGYNLSKEELQSCFEEFKDLCDKKKTVTDADIMAIVRHLAVADEVENGYALDWFAVHASNFTTATCTVCLLKEDVKYEDVSLGDGPIDAAFNAIDRIIKPVEHSFDLYRIESVSSGKDTLGEVHIKLSANGRSFSGRGLSTDIIEASILAYIGACNKLGAWVERREKAALAAKTETKEA
ncbi:MAG: 2-isopropylmalate synthase [Clostridiales bacterium]|nr:2-isopropylmalate synthase [Clostridiales bacterium]